VKAAILALGLYEGSGGPSKSVRSFATALQADVISWVDQPTFERERLIWDETTIVRGRSQPVLRQLLYPVAADLPAAEAIVAASDVVSVHSFWRWHCPWLHRASRKTGTPYWFVPHGALDPYAFESDRLFKRIFLRLLAKGFLHDAATIVCASAGEAAKVRDLLPGISCTVIPWPLADADFRVRDEHSRMLVREQIGIPANAFCLLYFGRLDPMKRPLETIDAFAEATLPDSHLVVMGNEFGITMKQCCSRARDRGIAERVHVVGAQFGTDRLRFIDACDAYISLSHRENFNFTATECLASGLPLILSAGNDIGEDLRPVGCGWMLRQKESAAAAIAAAHAAGSEQRIAIGAAGREWARSNLRYPEFAARVRDLAVSVAARGR